MGRTTEFHVSLSVKERQHLLKNSLSGQWKPRSVKRALIFSKQTSTSDLIREKTLRVIPDNYFPPDSLWESAYQFTKKAKLTPHKQKCPL